MILSPFFSAALTMIVNKINAGRQLSIGVIKRPSAMASLKGGAYV